MQVKNAIIWKIKGKQIEKYITRSISSGMSSVMWKMRATINHPYITNQQFILM